MSKGDANKIADAIYLAEGGKKTRFPYGIKSIKTSHPRNVCITTIQHSYAYWTGRGSFIDFLSYTYCPFEDRETWVKNVKWFLHIK